MTGRVEHLGLIDPGVSRRIVDLDVDGSHAAEQVELVVAGNNQARPRSSRHRRRLPRGPKSCGRIKDF